MSTFLNIEILNLLEVLNLAVNLNFFLRFRCRYGASELHPVASFIGGK